LIFQIYVKSPRLLVTSDATLSLAFVAHACKVLRMPFERDIIRERAARLAQGGVYLGTSSWKYRGWSGQLYDEARYTHRGKFTESRFERNCLTEYGNVFKAVSVDATY